MCDSAKVVFDEGHAQKLFAELALRLEAFDSLESVPEHIRAMLDECLAGRGFELSCERLGAALSNVLTGKPEQVSAGATGRWPIILLCLGTFIAGFGEVLGKTVIGCLK